MATALPSAKSGWKFGRISEKWSDFGFAGAEMW